MAWRGAPGFNPYYNPFNRKNGNDSSSDDSSSSDDENDYMDKLMPRPRAPPTIPLLNSTKPRERTILELSFSGVEDPLNKTIDLTDSQAESVIEESSTHTNFKQPETPKKTRTIDDHQQQMQQTTSKQHQTYFSSVENLLNKTIYLTENLADPGIEKVSAHSTFKKPDPPKKTHAKEAGQEELQQATNKQQPKKFPERMCPRMRYREKLLKESGVQLSEDGKQFVPPSSPQISMSKFKTLSIQNVRLHNELQSCRSKIQSLQQEISMVNYGFPPQMVATGTEKNPQKRKRTANISDAVLKSLQVPVVFQIPMRPVKKLKLNPLSEIESTSKLPQKPLKRLHVTQTQHQRKFGLTHLIQIPDVSGRENVNSNDSSSSGSTPSQYSLQDSGLGSSSSASSSASSNFNSFSKPKSKPKCSKGLSVPPVSQIPEATRIAMTMAENSQKRFEILSQKEKEGVSHSSCASSAPKTSTDNCCIRERLKVLCKNVPTGPTPPARFTTVNASQSKRVSAYQPHSQSTAKEKGRKSSTQLPSVPVFNRTKNTWDRRVNINSMDK